MCHEHEPMVMLNGTIRCRTCGEILPRMEETISLVSSQRRANRILQEIAVAGHYQANTFEDGFVVYSRSNNGNREELTVQKLSERNYRIVKRLISLQEV